MLSAVAVVATFVTAPTALADVPGGPQLPVDGAAAVAATTADALDRARTLGKSVLDTSQLTESTATYANPDGTFSSVLSGGPVRLKQANGSWADIDTKLTPLASGRFRAVNSKTSATLSSGGADRVLASSNIGGGVVGLGWPTNLPAAVPTGSSLTYPNAASGTDLQVSSLPTGYEFTLVIKSRPAGPVTFSLPLDLPSGWSAKEDTESGTVAILDASHAVRGRVGGVHSYGNTMDVHTGDLGPSSETATKLRQTASGPVVDVTPDPAFLQAPSTSYPVHVDPSVTMGDTYDTYTDRAFPSATYGTQPDLHVGYYTPGGGLKRSFINFDTSGIAGKIVTAATARLYVTHVWNCASYTTEVWGANATISGTTNYSNEPSPTTHYGNFTFANLGDTCSGGVNAATQTDVTSMATAWAANGASRNTMLLKAPNEGDVNQYRKFDSVDAGSATAPFIIVTYNNPNTPPGQVSGRSVSGYTCSGCNPGYTADTTPTLTGQAGDADGDALRYQYEVYSGYQSAVDASGNATVSGLTPVRSTTTAAIAPSTLSSYTVTPALPDGKYSYRVRAYDGAAYGVWSSGWVQFTIDSTGPVTTIASSTHPNQTLWYSNNKPNWTWGATAASPITGYSSALDQTATTTPDTISEGTGTAYNQPTALADGVWYLHIRAAGSTNIWGPAAHFRMNIDTTPPTAPTTVTSSTHPLGSTVANRNVTIAWAGASDGASGLSGYSIAFNNSSSTPADDTAEVASGTTTYTSAALSDGTWYAHVRALDNSITATGRTNASADVVYGPFTIDATGPSAPTITSTDHDQTSWSSNTTAHFSWTQSDASPVVAYSVVFDQVANTDPPLTASTVQASDIRQNIADGIWYLHVRAEDLAGNWGATGTFAVHIDSSGPAAPQVSSPTHPDQSQPYTSTAATLNWTASDISGISGYSWSLDSDPNGTPDNTVDGTSPNTSYSSLTADADYYFHVKALNGAGVWGSVATYTLHIYNLADPVASSGTLNVPQTTPTGSLPSTSVPAVGPAVAKLSDVFPQVHKLGQVLDPGPLLGSAPLFAGPLPATSSSAALLQHAIGSVKPPVPPAINLASGLIGGLGAFRAIPNVVPRISLSQVATYTADTTVYAPNGTSSTRTDVFVTCLPTLYSSTAGQVALPSTYDLRINFCPDAASLTSSEQRLTTTLDALASGLKAKVVITYVLGSTQLKLTVNASSAALPVDSGTGGTVASSFCNNPSSQAPLSVPGAPATTDTLDGFCAELRLATSGRIQDAHVSTAASGPVQQLVVEQDTLGTAGVVPNERVTIDGVPASAQHAYLIEGRTATSDVRETGLKVTLADPVARGSGTVENLTLESFAPDGSLAIRAALQDEAQNLSTDLSASLNANGDVSTAAIDGLRILGTQPARATQALNVQSWTSGVLTAALIDSGFASSFDQRLNVVYDSSNREIGVTSTQSFPNGPPVSGQLQLARYKSDGSPDAVLDLEGFSTTSVFTATVIGDPTNPDGAHLLKTDASVVANQLIQLLQYPSTGNPRRLVVASDSSSESRASAPVTGDNVVWHAAPRDFDISTTRTLQSDGVTPRTVEASGTTAAASQANRLEVGQLTNGTTATLVLQSLSAQFDTRIDLVGTTTDLTQVVIARTESSDQPSQALQLLQQDSNGLLVNVRFLGTASDEAALDKRAASSVMGRATGMPRSWTFGVNIAKDSNGRPTSATLSGSDSTYAATANLSLTDLTNGLALRLGGLTEQYTYGVNTTLDGNGNATAVQLVGSHNRDNPSGLLDLSYSGSRLYTSGLAHAFNEYVTVEGDPANPTGATVQQAQTIDSANGNPAQLFQIAAGTPTRFAVTVAGSGATPVLSTAGTRGAVVWTSAPANFALRLARDLNGNDTGRAGVAANQDPTANADLQVTLVCGSGDNTCTSGTSQSLRKHGGGNSWNIAASYSGSSSDPTGLTVISNDSSQNATDFAALSTSDATGLIQQFTFEGSGGNSTGAVGRTANASWLGAPANARVDYSRSTDSSGQKLVTLVGTSSVDNPDAIVTVTQTESGAVRNVRMHGAAATWSLSASADNSPSPRTLKFRTTSSQRHTSDYMIVTNSIDTLIRQRMVLRASSGALPDGIPGMDADLLYTGYGPDSEIDYWRTTDSNGLDTAFDAALANKDTAGNPTSLPNADLLVRLYGQPGGDPTETMRLTRLPATISSLHYTLPNTGNSNCLGGIGYNASDSTAHVQLVMQRPGGCFSGPLTADIDGMPSQGIPVATLDTNGIGDFATASVNGTPQEIPRMTISMPVPAGLAARFTQPQDLPSTEFCPEVGEVLGTHPLCIKAEVSAHNLAFDNLRLTLDGDRVSRLKVRTNVGQSDYNQYAQGSAGRDQGIRKALWASLPLVGIANLGNGEVRGRITGTDRAGVDSYIHEHIDCCLNISKTAHFDRDFTIPDGQPLRAQMWSWDLCSGGSSLVKCNRKGQALNYTKGSFVHTHIPGNTDDLPFLPSFDAGFYNAAAPTDPLNNSFAVPANTISYVVPNPYDALMASGTDGNGLWYVTARSGVYQTDWFWPMLLHVNATDPLGLTQGA